MYVLMLGANGDHCLFFNKLFFVENDLGIEIAWHSDTDDPTASIASKIAGAKTIGVDKHWSAHFLLSLMEKMPDTKFVNGSKCVDYVRMVKDKEEQELMIKASKINDKVLNDGKSVVFCIFVFRLVRMLFRDCAEAFFLSVQPKSSPEAVPSRRFAGHLLSWLHDGFDCRLLSVGDSVAGRLRLRLPSLFRPVCGVGVL